MDLLRQALSLIPEHLYDRNVFSDLSELEEIRLRCGRPPCGVFGGEEHPLSMVDVTSMELERVLEKATGASMHTSIEALRSGYLSYRGIRIGVCGTLIQEHNQIEGFRHISSLAIRIPKECRTISKTLPDQLYPLQYQNTVILSAPGGGKTTALRDLIRGLSNRGYRLSVVDERNELSCTEGAAACFDLGKMTDVLVGGDKRVSAMMLLRTMNPQILAMDEISSEEDCETIRQIIGCGVGVLATAHASGPDDFLRRPLYRRLLNEQAFTWAITIRLSGKKRVYQSERLSTCA